MAFSRTAIRSEAMNGRSPATILRRANRLIVRDIRYRLFLSAFYAALDTTSGRLTYANGGHNWPLWRQADTGETCWLAACGLVLGAFQEVELEEGTVEVRPGDLLVFYTDGVTEARSPSGALFGEERLRATVRASAGANAQQMQEAIVAAVEAFTGETRHSQTISRCSSSSGRSDWTILRLAGCPTSRYLTAWKSFCRLFLMPEYGILEMDG
jgi:sigma-B regulation protein RsbU (phosphoserine phosphatase)